MNLRHIVILLFTAICLTACASAEKAPVSTLGIVEGAMAHRTYFADPTAVLEGTKRVLGDYDFVITQTRETKPGFWTLDVKKGPTNLIKEHVSAVVVHHRGGKETIVYLIVDRAFWERWSRPPSWVDGFLSSIFERIP